MKNLKSEIKILTDIAIFYTWQKHSNICNFLHDFQYSNETRSYRRVKSVLFNTQGGMKGRDVEVNCVIVFSCTP